MKHEKPVRICDAEDWEQGDSFTYEGNQTVGVEIVDE